MEPSLVRLRVSFSVRSKDGNEATKGDMKRSSANGAASGAASGIQGIQGMLIYAQAIRASYSRVYSRELPEALKVGLPSVCGCASCGRFCGFSHRFQKAFIGIS